VRLFAVDAWDFCFSQTISSNHLTVEENVLLPMRLARKKNEQRLRALLDVLGLIYHRRAYPGELSGGEAVRAGMLNFPGFCRNGMKPRLDLIEANNFDAVVLDIMLPGRDGLSVLRILRLRSNAVPVIVVSSVPPIESLKSKTTLKKFD
jgi:CheY-like chemotaxis protein